jgi:subtilase family serine protease
VAAATPITVHVALPLRHGAQLQRLTAAQTRPGSASYHKWLTPTTFRARYGVSDRQVTRLASELRARHLVVTRAGSQAVSVTGSAAAVGRAFRTTFQKVRSDGRTRVASATIMTAPAALAAAGGTPVDISRAIRMRTTAVPTNRYGAYGPYWFDDLKQAYKYPAYGTPSNGKATGAGQTIGILMATAPNPDDTAAYFAHEHLAAPQVSVRNVDGGAPFDPNNGASFEVSLDVQQSGGMAPNAHIVVYSIPDLSDSSVFAGYVAIDEDNSVDVANSSFGECELFYTADYNNGHSQERILKAYHNLFMQGVSQGITFVASSGDNGALECAPPSYLQGSDGSFLLGVSTPAADPAVTAVGGTNLVTTYKQDKLTSKYVRENASADTLVPYDPYGTGGNLSGGYWGSGGGFSTIFKEPGWQKKNTDNTTGYRSVPDVSLQMGGCPSGISQHCNPEDSAVALAFDGGLYGAIGTSASAPDFAGTVALYNEAHGGGRSGNVDPMLYRLGGAQRGGDLGYRVFHDKIPGNNGYYDTAYTASGGTTGGYDEVLGNGTLIAKNFVFDGPGTPAAGNPQTPSNP